MECIVTRIQFSHVSKSYGEIAAVRDFTADIMPGRITAFLGANGSGKTTSMRLLLGLTTPTIGSALIDGVPYRELTHPLRTIGAMLDQGFAPHRTARNHLRITAAQARVPADRVDNVLDLVGLTDAGRRRVGGFSLGMRQRLALATALIGNPAALVMDEPFNGLDPAGIHTMRTFLRDFADQGGTVLLSSHLLAEIEYATDDALIIDRGHLVAAGPLTELLPAATAISVTSPDADLLAVALEEHGASVQCGAYNQLVVRNAPAEFIGRVAVQSGAVIVDMRAHGRDLESLFANLIQPEHAS
jgi:ABC-2 type transport system ATP-binding protein